MYLSFTIDLQVLLHCKSNDVSILGNLPLAGNFTLPLPEAHEWTLLHDDDDIDDQDKSLSEDDIMAIFEQFPHALAYKSLFMHASSSSCCTTVMLFAR